MGVQKNEMKNDSKMENEMKIVSANELRQLYESDVVARMGPYGSSDAFARHYGCVDAEEWIEYQVNKWESFGDRDKVAIDFIRSRDKLMKIREEYYEELLNYKELKRQLD